MRESRSITQRAERFRIGRAVRPDHVGSPILRRAARRRSRGLSLIEILIVLALIALVTGAVVLGTGQADSARLRHASTMISGAARVAFSRATASAKTVRLVMDFDESAIWLEEGDQPHLVQTRDVSGTGGAAAGTVAEKAALEESSRILKGPTAPRTNFTEIEATGLAASEPGKGHKALDRNITFRSVQTAHDLEPKKQGRAYLYFWPGGQTERAAIQLRIGKLKEGQTDDGQGGLTLLVAPLTAKVTIKDGAVALPEVKEDKDQSDREDPESF